VTALFLQLPLLVDCCLLSVPAAIIAAPILAASSSLSSSPLSPSKSNCHPSSFSSLPNLQADCQFVFCGDCHSS
jgi:hypothetical protein